MEMEAVPWSATGMQAPKAHPTRAAAGKGAHVRQGGMSMASAGVLGRVRWKSDLAARMSCMVMAESAGVTEWRAPGIYCWLPVSPLPAQPPLSPFGSSFSEDTTAQ